MLIIQPKRVTKIENKMNFSLSLTFYKKFKSVHCKNLGAKINAPIDMPKFQLADGEVV